MVAALRVLAAGGVTAVALLVHGAGGVLALEASYRDVVLADAPAGYWRLGETTGLAVDQTTNGNAGTYLGGLTRGVPGAIVGDPDGATRFLGGNGRVNMHDPASGVLDFGSADFCVEAFVKTTAASDQVVVGKHASGRYWELTITDDLGHVGQLRGVIRDGAVTRTGYSLAAVNNGAWHQVVTCFDRDSGTSIYVDGAPSGSSSGAMAGDVSNAADLQVGKVSGHGYFAGDIDEVAV